MTVPDWSSHTLPLACGKLAIHTIGSGEPLLMLHGGPGDTHDYLRGVAERIAGRRRCVLYDQRGNGGSPVSPADSTTISLDTFISDISSIGDWLGVERLSIFGHSWGAMLALLYNLAHPERVRSLAAVSTGPFDERYESAVSERLLASLTHDERALWRQLQLARAAARERGDDAEVGSLDRRLMSMRVKAWVFHEQLRAPFLEEYLREPPTNRRVHKLVWESAEGRFSWRGLAAISNRVWICAGVDDCMPSGQAEELARALPAAKLTLLDNCGHIPWLDSPARFYGELAEFLGW